MRLRRLPVVLAVFMVLTLLSGFDPTKAWAGLLAESGFNDSAGIHSDPFIGSPFVADVTVDNQGDGEAGWNGPWHRLGGFSDRAHVVSDVHYEGDQAVTVWADRIFGTSIERGWNEIVPKVRVDAQIMVRPGARLGGQLVRSCCGEIPPRTAASWLINDNGSISLFDTVINGYVTAPFSVIPNQWNKFSLIADTRTNTWEFAFNDVVFHRARQFKFLNATSYIDSVNFSAVETRVTYVDDVKIIAIDPTSGDVNGDGRLDAQDIDEITLATRGRPLDVGYDVDTDGRVNNNDRVAWVHSKKRTYFGDANTDGLFDSGDMTLVFQAGLYEDAIDRNAAWASGDWDGDGDFNSGDLIVAFADGGFEKGPRASVQAVPEPVGGLGLMTMLLAALGRVRRRCRADSATNSCRRLRAV